jgi:hypothetical protein
VLTRREKFEHVLLCLMMDTQNHFQVSPKIIPDRKNERKEGRKKERKKERTFVSFLIDSGTEIRDQQDVITKIS